MFITYDPNKNQQNIRDRDLSFDQAADLDWDNAWIYKDKRNDYGESAMLITACWMSDYTLFALVKQKRELG